VSYYYLSNKMEEKIVLDKFGVINPKREFISTVYIVHGEKVLLVWNKKVESFIPVGGHMEEGELPCESAVREAKEETGYDIGIIGGKKIGEEFTFPNGSKRVTLFPNFRIGLDVIKPDHHHINLAYIGKIISGEELMKSDEGDELKWFTIEELESSNSIFRSIKEDAKSAIKLAKEIDKLNE